VQLQISTVEDRGTVVNPKVKAYRDARAIAARKKLGFLFKGQGPDHKSYDTLMNYEAGDYAEEAFVIGWDEGFSHHKAMTEKLVAGLKIISVIDEASLAALKHIPKIAKLALEQHRLECGDGE